MVDGHVIRMIRAFLSQDQLSIRAIAEACGVSHTFVRTVARGKLMAAAS
jgi:hypothetical protein